MLADWSTGMHSVEIMVAGKTDMYVQVSYRAMSCS